MEPTAVSLTKTALGGVLGSAGTIMVNEAALLLVGRREVDFICSELQMMQSFLRVQLTAACTAKGCRKDTVRTCQKQVHDLARNLKKLLLHLTLHASRSRWLQWGSGLAGRHCVADRIRDLKASVVELDKRNQRCDVFAPDIALPAPEQQRHMHSDDEYPRAELAPDDKWQSIKRADQMRLANRVTHRRNECGVCVGPEWDGEVVRGEDAFCNDGPLIDRFDGHA